MVRLTDRPDMTLDVYRGRKTTIQQIPQLTLTKIFYLPWTTIISETRFQGQAVQKLQKCQIQTRSATQSVFDRICPKVNTFVSPSAYSRRVVGSY